MSAARSLSKEIIQLSDKFISDKNIIPALLHPTIAADLQTIGIHAKQAGEAIISDCPVRIQLSSMAIGRF